MSVVRSEEAVEGSDLETPTWVTSYQGMPRTVNVRRCRLNVVAGVDQGKIIAMGTPREIQARTLDQSRVEIKTSLAMPGDRESSLAAGATDYVTKPVDKELLLSVMATWISRARGTTSQLS